MVLYLGRMCQFVLHVVLLSHIGTLIRFLAADLAVPHEPLFPSQCPCETILLTPSGRIGKVGASHAAAARSIPVEAALIYTMHEALRGYCQLGWGV